MYETITLMNLFDWFPYSLISVSALGVAIALYKLPSIKAQSNVATSLWMNLLSAIYAIVFFGRNISLITSQSIIVGVIWGVGFASISALQMKALKKVELNTLFPVVTTLSLVFSAIIGLTVFNESISTLQEIGILIVACSVYLFLFKGLKFSYPVGVIGIGAVILVLSVVNKAVLKVGADNVDIESLQIIQYSAASISAFIFLLLRDGRKKAIKLLKTEGFKSGLLISVPSFMGGYALLVALTKGPFILVQSIHSMYIFIVAAIGYFFFKESLNRRKLTAILLAVVSLVLIRIG